MSDAPARAAREAAGLTLAAAARLGRITPAYLRRLETLNSFPHSLARLLAWRYGCRLEVFLPRGGGTPSEGTAPVRQPARSQVGEER
jgi:transcriptional regulator with XRE-family HTH domain